MRFHFRAKRAMTCKRDKHRLDAAIKVTAVNMEYAQLVFYFSDFLNGLQSTFSENVGLMVTGVNSSSLSLLAARTAT